MVPELIPEWMMNLWNKWEIRVIVLLSLFVQIVLIFLGNRRKYIASDWIRIIIWLAYLSADWFATVSLGVLSNQMGEISTNSTSDDSRSQLLAFWAPFLLVHLGGPDTITAYALEDNELWLRQLFGLAVQTWIIIYMFLKSWRNNWLSILSIPMLVVGIMKYGERTWARRFASQEHLKESMPTSTESSLNIIKLIEEKEFVLNNNTILNNVEEVLGAPYKGSHFDDARMLLDSWYFFNKFKYLFVDTNLSLRDWHSSRSFFLSHKWEEAFQVVENELGFMYDTLYTKAPIVYTLQGCILRLINVSFTLSALVVFIVYQKNIYPIVETTITYILLVGAIALEIYAMILHLSSDWDITWLIKHQNQSMAATLILSHVIQISKLRDSHRWSNTMAQYNLVSFCLKERPMMFPGIQKFFRIDKVLEMHRYKTKVSVTNKLKEFIFQQLVESSKNAEDFKALRLLRTSRGLKALEKANLEGLSWSIEGEFDQSILIWHIATNLCYTFDLDKFPGTSIKLECFRSGKSISDYMVYLLVMCPSVLSLRTGQLRVQASCDEAIKYFREHSREPTMDKKQLCNMLVEAYTINASAASKSGGETIRHVLFEACQLVGLLQKGLAIEKRWLLICEVWVEMLCYAAHQCRGSDHALQLGQGGELLTHVWLLMVHLGISEQFEIPPALK